MAYNPLNPNGQATMANSQPVVLASNQSSIATASSIIGLTPVAVTNTPSISGTVNIGTQSGSVVTFQGTNPWIVTGSVQASLTPAANQSVSGTVGASIIGNVPVVVQSSVAVAIVSGSIAASFTPPANQSVSGTVTTNQGTNPWIITGSVQGSFSPSANQSVSGTVGASIIGNVPVVIQSSVAVAIVSGSIAASFTPPANQSVSGTVQTDVRGSVATVIIGGSIAASFTPPANQSVSGTVQADVRSSVAVVIIGGSIAASFTPPANQSVSGTVTANQGTSPWIITGSVQGSFSPSGNQSVSGTVGASIIGLPPVNVTNFPTTQNVSGSVVGFQGGIWINSIISTNPSSTLVGSYGQRNDNVTSFVGGNLTWTPIATDSAGRNLVKPFAPDETSFRYVGSVVSTSVTLIAASVIGKRAYITDYWITNMGTASISTLVTFQDGSTSVIGYAPAPGGGGVVSPGIAIPPRTALSQDLAFKATTASSVLYVEVNGYQAP